MYPYITVLGRDIPTYGMMTVLGILADLLYFKAVAPRRNFPVVDAELAIVFSVIGIFLGSKILYLLTIIPQIAENISYLFTQPIQFLTWIFSGGFVFYGGFYGGVATCVIYCRVNKLDLWELSRTLIPTVPLFHAFGRVGCFLAGCCYGIENDTLGISFSASSIAPNNVPLIPVQIYEAVGEMILFIIVARVAGKPNSGRQTFSFWLIGYAILRFFLEFLRGDAYRGFIGVLSTSQVIAIISIIWGVYILIKVPIGRIYSLKKPE